MIVGGRENMGKPKGRSGASASGCSLSYRKKEGAFAFRFPVGGIGMQEFRFSEEEYLRGGGIGLIAERARVYGGKLGAAAAEAMDGVLLPLSSLRKAKSLSKKRRGDASSRPHPRSVALRRRLREGERKPRGVGHGRGPSLSEAEEGRRIMAEAVGRGAKECSYAPYRRYLVGWRKATGRRDEPKRLLREFCGKVDAEQKKKV